MVGADSKPGVVPAWLRWAPALSVGLGTLQDSRWHKSSVWAVLAGHVSRGQEQLGGVMTKGHFILDLGSTCRVGRSGGRRRVPPDVPRAREPTTDLLAYEWGN